MSGEFGSYISGYFDSQILYAADDLEGGSLEITRMWSQFFREFYPVAIAIAYAEACDYGPEAPILATIEYMSKLKQALYKIDDAMNVYRDVMKAAVKKEMESR
jgi:hypothetical protein